MKYRGNMSKADYAKMFKEILTLDEAYALHDKLDAEFAKEFPHHPDCPAVDGFACHCDELGETDEMAELRKAALNHRGEP